jgi:hypothetical protein
VEYVQSGTTALQDAKTLQKKTRKWMCCAIILLLVTAAVIVIVVSRLAGSYASRPPCTAVLNSSSGQHLRTGTRLVQITCIRCRVCRPAVCLYALCFGMPMHCMAWPDLHTVFGTGYRLSE